MAAIETAGLTKRYGPVTAVDDLSFAVREGAVTGFLGPNGAGKTTTLRMILALARPTAGNATVLGRPYAQLEPLLPLIADDLVKGSVLGAAATLGGSSPDEVSWAGALLVLGIWAGVFVLAGLLVDARRDVD